MTENELKKRTKTFALRVFKMCEALPRNVTARTIANQLVRSASSVAANYRAACRARSAADFRNKLAIVEEEADESAFWIELAIDAGLMPSALLADLAREADELTAIFVASRRTSARRGN